MSQIQFQFDPDTRQPVRHVNAQWQHSNARTTFQRPFYDTTVLTLTKKIPVLTNYQPEHSDRWNETSDNQLIIELLKDTTTTWEKRSKDCFPDVMELTLSKKTPAGQQTICCFVSFSSCVQWCKTNNLEFKMTVINVD